MLPSPTDVNGQQRHPNKSSAIATAAPTITQDDTNPIAILPNLGQSLADAQKARNSLTSSN